MTTYKDHPLAFLSGRVTSRGLRGRAESWRKQELSVEGLDVPATLDYAAELVETMNFSLLAVADLVETGEDASLVRSAILQLPAWNASVADKIRDVGQALRNGCRDPHGGSTASHLEMAADELRHLMSEADRLRIIPDGDAGRIREVAFGAIGRLVAQATHDAPVCRM